MKVWCVIKRMNSTRELHQKFSEALAAKKILVKRPAKGFIKHDYLVPGGPYDEQWDWDGFFIGMALACEISSEAIYLKNWCLNYLERVSKDGFTPGLLTPTGTDKRLKHIKPFFAQGCLFAGRFLHDYSWILPQWENLKKAVLYREKVYFNKKLGLACWHDGMESGADNNVAVLDFPEGIVAGADLNAFLYREYRALAKLAKIFKKSNDEQLFLKKSRDIKRAMLKYLWDQNDEIFYNLDTHAGRLIRRVTYASTIPLWAGVASPAQGKAMIRRYLLNLKKLWARHGVRTLSKDDVLYNQVNMIKPHSNWQGPVWPIANYLAMHGLMRYGFQKEAKALAEKLILLCLKDIEQSGGMHECYNAETGAPLAAPNFVSWNLLVGQMIPQQERNSDPFRL